MNNKLTDERVSNATLIRLIQWADQHNSHYVAAALCELQERRKADNQEPAGYHVIKECGKVGCSVATLEEAEKTRDFWNKKWTIRPYFYSAPPVQETGVYQDMLNIIGLLENNEWAEHCTSTVLGSLLESEITRLVSKEQSAPVVPEGLRMALSNAGISAPESDEMLAATHKRYIQALVTWVRERKPFQPVPVVPDDISGIIERFQYQADHLSEWHHIDEHSCKVNRRDLMTALEFMDSCRAAMLNGGKS
ncbi:hypothetical protein GMM32_03990 [Salmonella enterica subsp. diarizonae]|nr:hypothetical protein [Salmonella enterica subsp. diarizonae]EDU8206785.1 hypothetical protein [Salmonella enterica subsp. diarizonae]EEM9714008.1 hypothetical protein [Salmonella enterica subsp. diarizonae]EHG9469465.1 hypothetical protein [Salmonella enterica subsp. enterica serovar Newport]